MSVLISDAGYNMMESVFFQPAMPVVPIDTWGSPQKKTPTSHAFTSEYDHAKRNCCNDYVCVMLNNNHFLFVVIIKKNNNNYISDI